MNASNSVFSVGQEWFFWDETWTQYLGPFPDKAHAKEGLKVYAAFLSTGDYSGNSLAGTTWHDGEELA